MPDARDLPAGYLVTAAPHWRDPVTLAVQLPTERIRGATGGEERNLQFRGGGRQQDQVRHVVFTGMAGALEAIDAHRGDAEALGTAAAIAQGIAQPSDVLLLPHHGRRNPTAVHLLQRVRPRVCIASAASADGDTALGLAARTFGADLWVTGQHGTIELLGCDPPRVRASGDGRPLPPRLESPRPP